MSDHGPGDDEILKLRKGFNTKHKHTLSASVPERITLEEFRRAMDQAVDERNKEKRLKAKLEQEKRILDRAR